MTEANASILEDLTEEECYLLAILSDHSGIDLAEWTWTDDSEIDGCWRARNYQWRWFRCEAPLQIDQAARAVGKTVSIVLRMFAFPFLFPGEEAVITAPELVHLEPLTDLIENRFYSTRLGREMLPRGRGAITHRPFMANFNSGSRIIGRIPQRDGKGVKGCDSPDNLIWTAEGYKRAGDIAIGDLVLTHEGRYMPVTAVYYDENDCYEVKGQSSFAMTVSCDHRFYGAENLATPKQKRRFAELGFNDVEFLVEHQVYWATPTCFPRLPIPELDFGPTANFVDQRRDEFWFLVGQYLANGWVTQNGKSPVAKVQWCCPDEKAQMLLDAAESLDLHIGQTERTHSSADVLSLSNRAFGAWLSEQCGKLANGKRLPAFCLGMRSSWRQALLDGYLAGGDGYFEPIKKRWEVGSASKELVMGVQLLAQSLGYTVNCTFVQPNVTEICGVSLKKTPQLSWRIQIGHGYPFQIDDYRVAKVKSVTPVGKQPIVNIVVDGDHSYLSGSIMSHNIHPLWLELDEACFPGGTLVLTDRGLVEIQNVTLQDRVWTHNNRWRRVLAVVPKGVRPTIRLYGQGFPGLRVTAEHRLWGQRSRHWQSGGEGWEWIPAQEMRGCYWSSPLNAGVGTKLPPSISLSSTNRKRPIDYLDERFLFLMGVWIAEGSVSSAVGGGPINRATWSVTPVEAKTLADIFCDLGLTVSIGKVINTDGCVNVALNHSMAARWLADQCGSGAHQKRLPVWVLGLNERRRRAVLGGLLWGDGFDCKDPRYSPGRWKLTTVSKFLLVGSRLLAQTLGYYISAYELPPKDRIIRGKVVHGGISYQIVGGTKGQGLDQDEFRLTKVRRVVPAAPTEVFDLAVEDDASFLADGVVVHNSDYPTAGWTELNATLKRGNPNAVWRAHGVTRGIRDKFYEYTQDSPTNRWKVHRVVSMARPDWSDDEREEQIQLYGSRDSPDYRRNILGLHGDSTNPLFVLSRLMTCVDDDLTSDYNVGEYQNIRITEEMLNDRGFTHDISEFLVFPERHKEYSVTWAGMDVGFTSHPSEILIFGESRHNKKVPSEQSVLKLITRIHLERIANPVQCAIIRDVVRFYKPVAFSLDKTGVGLPLFQDLQDLHEIRGYGFSENILVDFDEQALAEMAEGDDDVKEAGIKKNVLEFSTDKLREMVDLKRILLPYDIGLIGEWQGQTWQFSKEAMDMYGRRRRVYSQGSFHALDASRMAVLGFVQHTLEEMMKARRHVEDAPVFDSFVL